MKLEKIFDAVRAAAPEQLQESWDNSGIQIRTGKDKDIRTVLTCLEISDAIVEEAIRENAGLIVTHHPLIFSKLSSADAKDVVGNQVIQLIQHDISVYSAHTSFDSAAHGTNQDLAEQLGLQDIVPMFPNVDFPECGMGRFGSYAAPLPFHTFAERLQQCVTQDSIRFAGRLPEQIHKVALCTGAGVEFADFASEQGADIYITGDVKYHDARHVDDIGFCIADAGHYGTEILFAENMAALLRASLGKDLRIISSSICISPWRPGAAEK